MNWDAIGAIGEIVGAIAVVATLFYLAVQVRHNTKLARADISKDLYLASREALMSLTADPELARTWAEITGSDDPDASRRHTFYQSFFRLYELQFSLQREGLLDPQIAQSYELIIRVFAGTPYFDHYWDSARGQFNVHFRQYVDDQRNRVAARTPATD